MFSGIGVVFLVLFKSPFMPVSLSLRFKLAGIAHIREPPERLTNASLSGEKNVARHVTATLTKDLGREGRVNNSIYLDLETSCGRGEMESYELGWAAFN